MSKKLYAYSTSTYYQKNWFKIGDTEKTARERVFEQDTTSNPEPLNLLFSYDLKENQTDKKFHKFLEKKGFYRTREDRKREWFYIPGGESQLKELINNYIHGIKRKNSFKPRPEQTDAIEKACMSYKNGKTKFLFNCKMRFGKCITSYWLMKKLECRQVLVLTYKTAVSDSWKNDLENHIDFDDYKFFDVRNIEKSNDKSKNTVYFCTMQSLLVNEESLSKRINWVYSHNWDMIIFDEMHYGMDSIRAKEIKDKFICSYKELHLSGTPFRALLNGDFDDSERYDWSYEDEQLAKKKNQLLGGNVYDILPKLSFYLIDILDSLIEKSHNKDIWLEEEGFTLQKLFATSRKNQKIYFENPDQVQMFLDTLSPLGGGKTKYSMRGDMSVWKIKEIDHDMLSHTLWRLPSIDSCTLLSKMLKSHPFFSKFKIINVAGEDVDVKNVESLNNLLNKHDNTITLSCGRYTTGVTVKKWGSVFMLNGTRSATDYWQTVFRSQSPYVIEHIIKKYNCYVFDFNPNRTIECIYEYKTKTKSNKTTIQQSILQWIECAPLFLYNEGRRWKKVDATDIVNSSVIGIQNRIDRFTASSGYDLSIAKSFICNVLKDTKAIKELSIKNIINLHKHLQGKDKIQLNNSNSNNKIDSSQAKIIKDLELKMKAMLLKFPRYLFNHPHINCCNDIINNLQLDFKTYMGISQDDFIQMLRYEIIKIDYLDECILGVKVFMKEEGLI